MNVADKVNAWDEIWNALCDGNVIALNRSDPNLGQALLEVRRLNISDAAVKSMNHIDKQGAWDTVWAQLIMNNPQMRQNPAGDKATVLDEIKRLQISDATVKRLHGIGYDGVTSTRELFTDEDIATLRALVSTTVWIRSVQLAHPNAVIKIHSDGFGYGDDEAINTIINTHNLVVRRCRAEFEAGQALWAKLDTYCFEHAIPAPDWPTTP